MTSASSALAKCDGNTSLRRAKVIYQGEPGVWLHQEIARCIVKDLERLKLKRKQISLLKVQLELRTKQINSARIIESEAAARNTLLRQITTQQQQQINAQQNHIKALDRTWRKPWIWVLIGAGVGAGAVFALGAI